jgi:hypothetical protein
MTMRAPAKTKGNAETWCGPYALAVVMGVDYDTAYARAMTTLERERPIEGMSNCQLIKVLLDYNFRFEIARFKQLAEQRMVYDSLLMEHRPRFIYKTLTQWFNSDLHKPDATYIVALTTHYVVVRGDWIIDNQSGKWIRFSKWRTYKRARVRSVFEITNAAAVERIAA